VLYKLAVIVTVLLTADMSAKTTASANATFFVIDAYFSRVSRVSLAPQDVSK